MKAQGHAGSSWCLTGSKAGHLKPAQGYRESWKRDFDCVCRRMDDWLPRGNPFPEASAAKQIILTGQVSISRAISSHIFLIVSVGYSNQVMFSKPSFYNLEVFTHGDQK